ncbi:MAG: hypothetical protein CMA63_02680 [Euryarchaeota archaeon]|jgi:hypothetical protein|nr:hypothetical protein [Euryarchaeota archaeon]
MGQMTRLDAVNQCLLAAGEAIISDLENQSGVDSSIAEYLLDQYTQDFQLRGLANNVYTYDLKVDSETKLISLPSNIMSLDIITPCYNSDGELVRVSVKKSGGGFILFNVTDQTTNWSSYSSKTLKGRIIVKLDWEDIDTPGQRSITASAARRYQMLTQGDRDMDSYLQQDELIYGTKGKSRDIFSKDRTIWDAGSYQKRRAVFRPHGGGMNIRYGRGRTS